MATIIDGDGHITEPRAVWEEYAEPAFRDLVIQLRRGEDGNDELWIAGERRPSSNPAPSCIPGALSNPDRKVNWDDILPGGYDPGSRLEVLDGEGFDQALLFPSIYLIWGDIRDSTLR